MKLLVFVLTHVSLSLFRVRSFISLFAFAPSISSCAHAFGFAFFLCWSRYLALASLRSLSRSASVTFAFSFLCVRVRSCLALAFSLSLYRSRLQPYINLNKRMINIHINIELYESSRRKPGWRFTAGVKFGVNMQLVDHPTIWRLLWVWSMFFKK